MIESRFNTIKSLDRNDQRCLHVMIISLNRIDVILNCVKHELNDLSLNTSNIVQRCTQKGWDISYVVAKQKVSYLPHFLVFSVLPNPSISLGESFITQVFDWFGV